MIVKIRAVKIPVAAVKIVKKVKMIVEYFHAKESICDIFTRDIDSMRFFVQ